MSNTGHVTLIGAGPGDPGLITVNAVTALRHADVVVYDHLISRDLLSYAPSQAELIYVGKRAGKHTMPQELINQLLVDEAREGKQVVRLKGGDPFIFGRGGEECMFLKENGVVYDVIPGISATSAVAAYAGIPLTHRQVSTSFLVVTGHEPAAKGRVDIDWKTVAELGGTLVIFMGIKNLPHITSELIKYGRNQNTPAAVIRWGTMPEQQTISATLATIAQDIEQAQLKPPGLIVIGEVVGLREQINWYEQLPLFGISAVIPRTHQRPSAIAKMLKDQGAGVFEFSCPPANPRKQTSNHDEILDVIVQTDWLVFTDSESVVLVFDLIHQKELDTRYLAKQKFAALDDDIAARLRDYGIKADFTTNRTCTPPLVKEFATQHHLQEQQFLLLYNEHAPKKLAEYLTKRGGIPRPMGITSPNLDYARFPNFDERALDLLIFLSVQAVEDFMAHAGDHLIQRVKNESTIASVSPLSSEVLRQRGLPVHIEPDKPLTAHLFEAIMRHFQNKPQLAGAM